jgi:polyisoprenoid-binding protein YceI
VRHPLRWLIVALVVVVVGVGAAVAWYVFGDDAPPKPTLSARDSESTVSGGAAASPDGTWRVSPGEKFYVGYRIKELFGGATIKRDAVGRTGDTTGTMTIANGQVRTTRVEADVSTLESDRAARDSYIHDHALETDRFPQATFALSSPIALPASAKRGSDVHVSATGTLTMHGVTKPVTLQLDARWDGNAIEVAGTAPIKLADYGIERPETPVVSVDDNGSLEVHLRFTRAAAA